MTDDLLRAREVLARWKAALDAQTNADFLTSYTIGAEELRALVDLATPQPVETGEVIQADRDAAAAYYYSAGGSPHIAREIREGRKDNWFRVQRFTDHRLAFASPTPEPSGAVVEASNALIERVAEALYIVSPLPETCASLEAMPWIDFADHHREVAASIRIQARAVLASLDAGSASS